MSQHIGPRVISATGGSIKRVGPYRIHTFPSELVTDGLVLNLDAGDPRSYPGSGTTWTDLSGRGYNGTLVNSSYSNGDGGNISFNGTNAKVTFPSTNIPLNGAVTISVWFKSSSGTSYQNIFDTPDYTSGIWITTNYNSNTGKLFASFSTTSNFLQASYSANTWYNLVLVGDNNIGASLYLNGVLVSSNTVKNVPSMVDLNTARLGNVDADRANEWFNGNISAFQVYNRALSAAEVAQNYDALKVRYTSYTNTFTPLCAGNSGKVEVLCVAGGGGGGAQHGGGGGGAGGLLYNSAFSVNSSSGIGVTIGAGGAPETNGGNSVFSSLTAIGGGRGGSEASFQNGSAGGSGGGGSGFTTATTGSSGTSGQGFSGGRGGFPDTGSSYGHGGGGGGAGGVGGDGTEGNGTGAGTAGNGGAGLLYNISGTPQFYAGGGGGGFWGTINLGGLGGSGVGGKGGENGGSNVRPATNGVPNTGSGGGGSQGLPDANSQRNSSNGSNGIVIVRYPATDYNVELLIVGGGGAGGGSATSAGGGGGGGAGGLLYYSSYSVSAGTKYTVTVGAGGTGQNATTGANGGNGNNSVFGPLVAFGGGGGSGGIGGNTGNNGGSGGGGGYRVYNTVANGGFGVAGQGNNGGGVLSISASGAGGGGAGGAGQSNTGSGGGVGGLGGVGLSYAITGSSVTYATGGQGGEASSTIGSANTGNGGAGTYAAANTNTGYAGGSGIVIIAYQGPQRGIGGTVDTTSRPGYTLHKFTTVGTDFFIP